MTKNPSGALHPLPLLLAWVVIAFGASRLWPLSFPSSAVSTVGGRVLMGLGGVLLVWAQVEFRRHGTTESHRLPTTVLITSGPFRYSRNPIYVGLTALMLGISLAYNNFWALGLTFVAVVAIHRLTVVKEEAYLLREFGDTYREYRRTVRRWL